MNYRGKSWVEKQDDNNISYFELGKFSIPIYCETCFSSFKEPGPFEIYLKAKSVMNYVELMSRYHLVEIGHLDPIVFLDSYRIPMNADFGALLNGDNYLEVKR